MQTYHNASFSITINPQRKHHYKYHSCFVCGMPIVFNQYREITYCRVVHQGCDYEDIKMPTVFYK